MKKLLVVLAVITVGICWYSDYCLKCSRQEVVPEPIFLRYVDFATLHITNCIPSLRINWMNDAVYYVTNSMVWDEERNKTLPTNSTFFYLKTVITTNKVHPMLFNFGDRLVELGAREDNVIVWRYKQ